MMRLSEEELRDEIIAHLKHDQLKSERGVSEAVIDSMEDISIVCVTFATADRDEGGQTARYTVGAGFWLDPRVADTTDTPLALYKLAGATGLAGYTFVQNMGDVSAACLRVAKVTEAECEQALREVN